MLYCTVLYYDVLQVAKQDPDHAIRDLYNAIAAGDHPTWTMYIQVMTFQQAEQWYFNPFDLTKVNRDISLTHLLNNIYLQHTDLGVAAR